MGRAESSGAPNGRQSFEMFPPDSERLAEMIENAEEGENSKFQGIAGFKIHYADGSVAFVDVGNSGIFQVNGKAKRIPGPEFVRLLQKYWSTVVQRGTSADSGAAGNRTD